MSPPQVKAALIRPILNLPLAVAVAEPDENSSRKYEPAMRAMQQIPPQRVRSHHCARHVPSATTGGNPEAVPERRTRQSGVAPRRDDAVASGARRTHQFNGAHVPTEHDEEKGKERGCHWLWEGARSRAGACGAAILRPVDRSMHLTPPRRC